jgi:hypothetical protein
MITFKELMGNHIVSDIPYIHQINMERSLKAYNCIREAYNKSMIITSGYRSREDHLRIYSKKGITDNKLIPWGSMHLIGCAIDVYDPNGEFNSWCKNNNSILEKADVYLEERQGPWQHIQTNPFKSYKVGGSRWFNP